VKHPFRWIAVAVGLGVGILAVVLALTVSSDPQRELNTSRLVGKRVPTYQVVGFDGTPISEQSLAGKTVLVNFWNSWCIPCREEHPALAEWYSQHKGDRNVVLLGIVREDDKDSARQWVQDEKVDWPVAFDPGGKAALDFGTRGQPETYAIGPDGVVAGSLFGPASVKALDQMVAAAQGSG
jgi:cytochrome c biogenesis protein CcmG, thiol:disulfide interchange protein DsbE